MDAMYERIKPDSQKKELMLDLQQKIIIILKNEWKVFKNKLEMLTPLSYVKSRNDTKI